MKKNIRKTLIVTLAFLSFHKVAGQHENIETNTTAEESRVDIDFNNVDENLVNPNATEEAVTLHNYLKDTYGKRSLSGQQTHYQSADPVVDIRDIINISGKTPAIRGYDLINYSPSRESNGSSSSQTEEAIEWGGRGGVVSVLWHWNAPEGYLKEGADWYSGFYTDATDFDPSIAMNDLESDEYALIIRDIDRIAEELQIFEDANVPVLWRPLHEAAGGWFWWGAHGSEACVWLWKLMYDRITNYHEIDNLIWIWTEQYNINPEAWYPGDDYVDILGMDIYLNPMDTSPSLTYYNEVAGNHPNKIVAITESRTMPDPHEMIKQGAHWGWFLTWSSEFDFGELLERNTAGFINDVYNHEYVITFDELPDFSTYERTDFTPIELPLALDEPEHDLISLYPNPVKDKLTISLENLSDVYFVSIYNQLGQKINHLDKRQLSSQFTVDFSSQQTGLYIVKIMSESGSQSFRIIKG